MKQLIPVFFLIASHTFGQSTERIITAGSAITEIVCALGDCDKIIASDRTSLYPKHIQQLPSIGYRSGINAEGIISLKPTLIIAENEYVEEAVLQQLASTGVKLVIVDQRYSFEDTKKAINQIASVLGRDAEGKKLIASNESLIAESKAVLDRVTNSPKVLCVFNRGTATVSVAGKKTFAEILHYVKATNALNNIDGYKPLNTEALIASNPDYLLMASTGFESIGGMEGVLKIPGVAQTTTGKKKQIIVIETMKLTNFGPRFGEAVKELVAALYSELQAKP